MCKACGTHILMGGLIRSAAGAGERRLQNVLRGLCRKGSVRHTSGSRRSGASRCRGSRQIGGFRVEQVVLLQVKQCECRVEGGSELRIVTWRVGKRKLNFIREVPELRRCRRKETQQRCGRR